MRQRLKNGEMYINMKKSDNPTKVPRVYKEVEYADFINFISQGLWRNNKLLARICSVDEDTINEWKKRPDAIAARKESLQDSLRKWKRVGKVEDQLKEQEMEFDPEKTEAKITIEVSNINDV
jgi:hypothetical protein